MPISRKRRAPGEVRDAVIQALAEQASGAPLKQIVSRVSELVGAVPSSSIRSSLQLNTPGKFEHPRRGFYRLAVALRDQAPPKRRKKKYRMHCVGKASVIQADCMDWFTDREAKSIHAVVTDPPYGLIEYSSKEQAKLRNGRGGVWRIPPAFDGARRSPLPRFTVLKPFELENLERFFRDWARLLVRVLVPGANVLVASNPLLSFLVSGALAQAGLERRGEIIRLVMTMRGGDRPKGAHEEFQDVSVMPRSMWEPWLLFRKPLEGRVQDNLRRWKTGGFRRPSAKQPFGDVIRSSPTQKGERALAPHPSLKPQSFMRHIVRGVLPLGEGVVLDPFCGAGSTLAAAEAVGYESVGIELDSKYYRLACKAVPMLRDYQR